MNIITTLLASSVAANFFERFDSLRLEPVWKHNWTPNKCHMLDQFGNLQPRGFKLDQGSNIQGIDNYNFKTDEIGLLPQYAKSIYMISRDLETPI